SKINKAEDFALQDYYIRETSRKLGVEEAGLVNLVNKFIRERMEQERRQAKRDEPEPLPGDLSVSPEQLPDLHTADAEEAQEWELVRVLVEHGQKTYEGYEHVADLIYQRVDPDLFE